MFDNKNITDNEFRISYVKTFCYNKAVQYAKIIRYYHIYVKYLEHFALPYDEEQNVLLILMC